MKKYLLYGIGKSNQAVKKYFDEMHIDYDIYLDSMDFKDVSITSNMVVIKSPGISNNTALMKLLLEKNISILTDIGLFYQLFSNIFYIGITGTLGKTTSTLICYHLLKDELKDINIAGNIGIPIFDYALNPPKYLIVELSSFELEYCGNFKPNIMLYLNCYAHHLNHHQGFNQYLASKFKPIKNMKENDLIIINEELISKIKYLHPKARVISFSKNDQLPFFSIQNQFLNYPYNQNNLKGIIHIIHFFNLSKEMINERLNTFSPPSYRMEVIKKTNNLIIINDSKSTCVKATIEAIKTVISNYPNYEFNLIMGGKLDIKELSNYKEELTLWLKKLKCFYYGENKTLLNQLNPSIAVETLAEVIDEIDWKTTKQLILFSPGAQSFDQFNSFILRGMFFNNLISKKINHL